MNGTYNKFTQCVKPQDYIPYGGTPVVALLAIFLAPFAWLTSVPGVLVLIGVTIILITFVRWYLYGRLVCLGAQFTCKDQHGNPVGLAGQLECAIGVVSGLGHPSSISIIKKAGDNDATMGVILAPGPTDVDGDHPDVFTHVQGYLIAKNQTIINMDLGYSTSDDHLKHYIRQLHCEFEGSGIITFLTFLEVFLAFLVGVLLLETLASVAVPILVLIIAMLGWLLAGAGLDIFDPGTYGDPTDVSPALAQLQNGDIVAVSGDWIYDSGHDGWNEIHAVHNCQIIGKFPLDDQGNFATNPDGTPAWPPDLCPPNSGIGVDTDAKVQQARCFWCFAMQDANGAVTGGSKNDPGNNWVVHPVIDGCNPPPLIV